MQEVFSYGNIGNICLALNNKSLNVFNIYRISIHSGIQFFNKNRLELTLQSFKKHCKITPFFRSSIDTESRAQNSTSSF